jgi:hypothetical protein
MTVRNLFSSENRVLVSRSKEGSLGNRVCHGADVGAIRSKLLWWNSPFVPERERRYHHPSEDFAVSFPGWNYAIVQAWELSTQAS